MKRKICLFGLILVFLAACAGSQQSPSEIIKQAVGIEKDMAESILFDARVLFNTKNITQEQFDAVKNAYDELRVGQDLVIDSYIAFLRKPNPETENIYRVNVLNVIKYMKALTSAAKVLGIIKEA